MWGPRRLLIRFLTPLVWGLSDARKRQALQKFSLIEKDSGCQLLTAMDHVHAPEVRAQLFQHVLEEFHHADLFRRACEACSDAPLDVPVVTRDALIAQDAGADVVMDFVSYVHVGESAVNGDFDVYAHSPVDPRVQGVFKAVRADEANHERGSWELLESLAGGDRLKLRWALVKARVKRAWRSYVLAMRGVGEIPLTLLLGVLYLVAGPLVRGPLGRRLDMPTGEQLRILTSQLGASDAKR